MSWSRQVTIWCDICGEWDQIPTNSVKRARKEVKRKGWKFRKGKDVCSGCDS